jgi:hypothetical protein
MGNAYSLRFRLRPSGAPTVTNLEIVEGMFGALEDLGVANDVSEIGPDGTYALWLEVIAADPAAAVEQSIRHLRVAQGLTRPDTEPDETVSIEILVGSGSSPDGSAMPAAI